MVVLHPAKIITPDEVLSRACSGDSKAFGQIYELWIEPVYRYVYLKTKDDDVAEDITSEVFIKAWKGLKTYKPKSDVKFSTWLFSIARNTIIDYYRTVKRDLSFEDLPEIADLEGTTDLYPEQTNLREALSQLKPEYQKVLELRYIEDVPIAKTAQIMKKKEGNIRAITNRALNALKEYLSSAKKQS